jgi:transcriptional regulator with XRE-family HTH domain
VSVSAAPTPTGFGHLLRHWRAVRAKSQLDLACDAETTPRYVSFVETGRAQPSRQMVVRLARALDVPLRERNELLLAAGYAPLYSSAPLSSPLLKRVEQALASMLGQHEPFPAVVLDRGWQVLRTSNGAQRLFGRLFAPRPVPAPANVLRLVIEPARCATSYVTGPRSCQRFLTGRTRRRSAAYSTRRRLSLSGTFADGLTSPGS